MSRGGRSLLARYREGLGGIRGGGARKGASSEEASEVVGSTVSVGVSLEDLSGTERRRTREGSLLDSLRTSSSSFS